MAKDKNINQFLENKFYIELIIATILFIIAIKLDSLVTFIIYLLYFIIMLEIVRAVGSFIRERRVQIRILIDAFIVLALREFIVNVVKINKQEFNSFEDIFSNTINFHILIFAGVVVFLFFVRFLAMQTTPEKYKNIKVNKKKKDKLSLEKKDVKNSSV